MPTKLQYEKLIENFNFSDVTITEVNRDRYFSNADEIIKWIDQPSLVPFMKCIPEEKKVDFRKEVIDAMLQRTQKIDGTCFETFRRIHIKAFK